MKNGTYVFGAVGILLDNIWTALSGTVHNHYQSIDPKRKHERY